MQDKAILKPTAEDIKAWKALHGPNNVKFLEVEIGDKKYEFYVKVPGRADIMAIERYTSENSTEKATNILLGCVIGGDLDVIEKSAAVYTNIIQAISGLVQVGSFEIKNV